MSVLGAVLVPHAPTLIAQGKAAEDTQELAPLRESMELLGERIAILKPQTLVFVSPHGSCFTDAFAIKGVARLKGFLPDGKLNLDVPCDLELVDTLSESARELGVTTFAVRADERRFEFSLELDHGVSVPLYFLQTKVSPSIISVSTSDLGAHDHYRLGAAIQRASKMLKRAVVVIASGDLSHPESLEPGQKDCGVEAFDSEVVENLRRGEFRKLLEMDSERVDRIGGCGIMPLMVLLGAFEGQEVLSEVLSYENPFGSGYLVAQVSPKGKARGGLLAELASLETAETKRRRQGESPPAQLARQAVETYVRFGKVIKPLQDLPEYMQKPGGVFVSLKTGRALRGCIGTVAATASSIAEEIVQNAVHSAARDPRFYPVEVAELDYLVYSVDILEEPEEIPDAGYLDHKKYGVYVKCGSRCGLLLPDIDGVNSVEEQLSIAKQKGDIADDEPAQLFRFQVTRYK